MQIQLVSVSERPPPWVQAGYHEYAKRLPRDVQLILREIAPAKRSKASNPQQWSQQEGERLLASIPDHAHVVALDARGRQWSSLELASVLQRWLASGRTVVLLVGGADGLSPACLRRADETWSLSALTFPHPLVRVLIAEQIYRAWTVLQNHPYHRA